MRGAYNMMANLPKEELEKGVICASTGNEAQGIAMAANKLGSEVVIVMPTTTPPIQVRTYFFTYINFFILSSYFPFPIQITMLVCINLSIV